MKQLRKTIFPLLLAVILILSTGMTVFATGEGNIDGGGGGMGSGTKSDVWRDPAQQTSQPDPPEPSAFYLLRNS